MLKTVHYQGVEYKLISGRWVDGKNFIVPQGLQFELNKIYAEENSLSDRSVFELVQDADGFKDTGSFSLAIRYYEEAVFRAEKETVVYILPRITSCYRKCGMPQKAIDLFSQVKKNFGSDVFSAALLTSAGAAYCDLRKYGDALRCANRAFALSNGKADENLSNLYSRIKKETT